MKGKNTASGEGCNSSDRVEDSVNTKLKDGHTVGDPIWVKLHGDSWWPAQVVNEDTISQSIKPRKKSEGLVFVRLYGSYDYLYVDPVKCHSEFVMVLKKNNGCHREIFKKALKKGSRTGGSHGHGPHGRKSTENKRADPSKDKNGRNINLVMKQNAAKRNNDPKSPNAHNIEKGKASRQDVTEKKSKRENYSGSSVEECIAKSKPSRQNSLQKKVMKDRMKAGSKAASKDETTNTPRRKSSSSSAVQAESKTGEQDETRKKLRENNQNNEKEAKQKPNARSNGANKNETTMTSKRKSSSSSDVQAESKSGEQDGTRKKLRENNQNDDKQAKQKLDSPRADSTSSGRSPELSARRVKVMQSLGLIAPTGSPYHKHRK